MPDGRKGPPHDKTAWSLNGRGVDTVCCMAGLGRQRTAPLTCALGGIRFKLMFGELAFQVTNISVVDFSLSKSSCDNGRRLRGHH